MQTNTIIIFYKINNNYARLSELISLTNIKLGLYLRSTFNNNIIVCTKFSEFSNKTHNNLIYKSKKSAKINTH